MAKAAPDGGVSPPRRGDVIVEALGDGIVSKTRDPVIARAWDLTASTPRSKTRS